MKFVTSSLARIYSSSPAVEGATLIIASKQQPCHYSHINPSELKAILKSHIPLCVVIASAVHPFKLYCGTKVHTVAPLHSLQ